MSLTFDLFELPPARPREEVHAKAIARGARCDICPLYGCGRGPVMGDIVPNAKLTIIGEGPGEKELLAERPFVGWSGQRLDESLVGGGLRREAATITNASLCMQPEGVGYKEYCDFLVSVWQRRVKSALRKGLEPPAPPVFPHHACAPRLRRDVEESNAKVILAVGKFALESVARELGVAQGAAQISPGDPYCAPISKQHGAPIRLRDGRILLSSFHPAMAAPGRKRSEWLPVIQENLARAAWVAAHDGYIPWREPVGKINPTVAEVLEFCRLLSLTGAETTIDIETDGINIFTAAIRCIGMGALINGREELMAIPIRHMDGSLWYTHDETMRIAYAIRDVCDRNPLVFQNGAFDTAVLLQRGFMTNRLKSWTDSLLLHHCTPDNDLPHDLGFIARRFFCLPMWKASIDHKSVDNVDDELLHVYCIKDVAVTHRLIQPLRAQIQKYQTQLQYETDAKLSPILREMGELGLIIDEERRGYFSEALTWYSQRELYQFRELVGDPKFNPRSVPQLQELLFGKWGYLPVVLDREGNEIDRSIAVDDWRHKMLQEEDDENEDDPEYGSTSSGALIELMKKREMDEKHLAAIKTLLEYRAYDKLSGTYVDNMPVRAVDWRSFGHEVGVVPAVDVLRWNAKRDEYTTVESLTQRSALSLLNPQFKGFVVPTGRLASSNPNVQNWPALGKANMREMVVASPDHELVMADYCLAPGTRVLTADLHWKKIEDIQVGESLVGFDEHVRRDAKMKPSIVESTARFVRPCYEIVTSRGTVIASAEHNWLARKFKRKRGWVRTDELEPGDFIAYYCDPWAYDNTREGGYIEGFLDGEGYIGGSYAALVKGRSRVSSSGTCVQFGQNDGPVLRYVLRLLQERGIEYTHKKPSKLKRGTKYVTHPSTGRTRKIKIRNKVHRITITGERAGLRFLGRFRPRRLLQKAGACWIGGRTWGRLTKPAIVQSVRFLGLRETVALQTSTRTFVAEGMLTHNCQLEARIYAVEANDQVLLQAIHEGKDIHSMNAAALLAKDRSEIEYWYKRVELGEGVEPSKRKTYRKLWRTIAKRFAFLEIYGGEPGKLFSVMAQQRNKEDGELSFPNIKRGDVDTWHDNWHNLHPETKQWHYICHKDYERAGCSRVQGLDWRARYFLGGLSSKNAVPNVRIQGKAASLANRALIALVEAVPFRSLSYWTGCNLQVHDALCLQVPKYYTEKAQKILYDCMYYEEKGVSYFAEVGTAERWSKTE